LSNVDFIFETDQAQIYPASEQGLGIEVDNCFVECATRDKYDLFLSDVLKKKENSARLGCIVRKNI
jgi:hypothetical protein